MRTQYSPDAPIAAAPLSSIIAATAASLMEQLSGTTEIPAFPAPNSSVAISMLFDMSTAMRAPGVKPSASSPFAT